MSSRREGILHVRCLRLGLTVKFNLSLTFNLADDLYANSFVLRSLNNERVYIGLFRAKSVPISFHF